MSVAKNFLPPSWTGIAAGTRVMAVEHAAALPKHVFFGIQSGISQWILEVKSLVAGGRGSRNASHRVVMG
ncbi:hypothetical protein N0K08_11400 [Acidovorax sp. Be4]|uniref:Uncharacterized protein n=1 Tax=Acidovorax bellezanensis TaxID=2976702 RepID=A0ABT2PLA3_9BURK|nr:hypothetical protein [Acidovorax sp. Be4]MCT9811243.1 hypothetical protein [Acidovorax sp. Be4]